MKRRVFMKSAVGTGLAGSLAGCMNLLENDESGSSQHEGKWKETIKSDYPSAYDRLGTIFDDVTTAFSNYDMESYDDAATICNNLRSVIQATREEFADIEVAAQYLSEDDIEVSASSGAEACVHLESTIERLEGACVDAKEYGPDVGDTKYELAKDSFDKAKGSRIVLMDPELVDTFL